MEIKQGPSPIYKTKSDKPDGMPACLQVDSEIKMFRTTGQGSARDQRGVPRLSWMLHYRNEKEREGGKGGEVGRGNSR